MPGNARPSLFHPTFIGNFGGVLLEMEGTTKKSFDWSVPLDAAAFMQTMLQLDKADPLRYPPKPTARIPGVPGRAVVRTY